MIDDAYPDAKATIASRYTVIRPLGKGTGGSVVLARDLYGPRDDLVAVKLLTPDAADGVQGQMILREFDILTQLKHPHLVSVRDFGSLDGGGLFLAEEFVEGFSLQDAHLGVGYPFESVILEILFALAYIHEIGIVHRDIKPANIMILNLDDPLATPHAKLVDFGLSSADPTTDRLWGGTRFFMAPEVLRREPATPKSDLFSLGISLYYILCGVQPIADLDEEADDPTVIAPHFLNRKVSLGLSRFVMALLRRIPSVDFQNGADALDAFLHDVIQQHGKVFFELGVDPVFFARGHARFEHQFVHMISERIVKELALMQDNDTIGRNILIRSSSPPEVRHLMQMLMNHRKRADQQIVELNPTSCKQHVPWIISFLESFYQFASEVKAPNLKELHWNFQILFLFSILYGAPRDAVDSEHEEADFQLFNTKQYYNWFSRHYALLRTSIHPDDPIYLFYDEISTRYTPAQYAAFRDYFSHLMTVTTAFLVIGTNQDYPLKWHQESHVPLPSVSAMNFSAMDIRRYLDSVFGVEASLDLPYDELLSAAKTSTRFVRDLPIDLYSHGLRSLRDTIDAGASRSRFSIQNSPIFEAGSYVVPDSLEHLFRRRLLRVSANEKQILDVLAVVSDDIDWVVLREILREDGLVIPDIDYLVYALIFRFLLYYSVTKELRIVQRMDPILRQVVLSSVTDSRLTVIRSKICQVMEDMWYQGRVRSQQVALQLTEYSPVSASHYWEIAGDDSSQLQSLDPHSIRQSCDEFSRSVALLQNAKDPVPPPRLANLRRKLAVAQITCAEVAAAREQVESAWKEIASLTVYWTKYRVITQAFDLERICGDAEKFDVWEVRAGREIPMLLEAPEMNLLFVWRDRLVGAFTSVLRRLNQAKRIASFLNDPRLDVTISVEYAQTYEETGDPQKALELYEDAIQKSKELRTAQVAIAAYIHCALLYLRNQEQGAKVSSALYMGYRYSIRAGRVDLVARAFHGFSLLNLAQDDLLEAERFNHHATYLAKRIKHPELQALCRYVDALILERRSPDDLTAKQVILELADLATEKSFVSNLPFTTRGMLLQAACDRPHYHSNDLSLKRYRSVLKAMEQHIAERIQAG